MLIKCISVVLETFVGAHINNAHMYKSIQNLFFIEAPTKTEPRAGANTSLRQNP